MQLVNIPKTESYQVIYLQLTNNYKAMSSWLLYGSNNQAMLDTSLAFAQKVLPYNSDDLLHVTRGNIGVEDVRSIIRFLSVTSSHNNGYKIVIINNIANMNYNAANAILKVLEEPPTRSIIIMISDSLYVVPNTIRSRCCKLYCPDDSDSLMHLDDFDVSLYKEMLEACKNGTYFSNNGGSEEVLKLLQILILRLIKVKSSCSLVKEIFTDERLELGTCSCTVEYLYKKWDSVLQLSNNKDTFHLAEQQVNILLCNSFNE